MITGVRWRGGGLAPGARKGHPGTVASLRTPFVVLGVLFGAIAVRVLLVWDQLPPVMASHFDASGTPNGWMSRGVFFAVIGAAGGGTTLLVAASGLWLRLIPSHLINLPNREHWLTPERRDETLRRMGAWMAWFGVLTGGLMALVTELSLRANLERAPLASGPIWAGLGIYVATTIAMIVRLYRMFRLPGAR